MLDTLRGFWFIILVLMKNNKGISKKLSWRCLMRNRAYVPSERRMTQSATFVPVGPVSISPPTFLKNR